MYQNEYPIPYIPKQRPKSAVYPTFNDKSYRVPACSTCLNFAHSTINCNHLVCIRCGWYIVEDAPDNTSWTAYKDPDTGETLKDTPYHAHCYTYLIHLVMRDGDEAPNYNSMYGDRII
jgi:hypothetical protein